MSLRTLLALAAATQFSFANVAYATAYDMPQEDQNAAADHSPVANLEDHFVLSTDLELEKFDIDEEPLTSSAEDAQQSFAEAAQQQMQLVDPLPNQDDDQDSTGDETNSAVILPAGTRFSVVDGIIGEEDGQKYIQVQTDSGFKFWTRENAFDDAQYIAEVQVAGKASGKRPGWRVAPAGRNKGKIKCHEGTDISMPNGTPVGVRMAGKVVHAGWMQGYGKTVDINNGNMMTRYAHLSKISVRVGQSVSVGTNLGRSGSTGNVTGPHLHYEHKRIGTSMCGGKLKPSKKNAKANKRRSAKNSKKKRRK